MATDCSGEEVRESSVVSYADLLNSLHVRAHTLLDELKAYQTRLRSQNKVQEVEMRVFKRGIESEAKSLEKLKQNLASSSGQNHYFRAAEDEETPQLHALRSSNLPFYEAVWSIAKSSQGVTALGKRVHTKTKVRTRQDPTKHDNGSPNNAPTGLQHLERKGVLVDIIAENGLEWIKVSTVTERRLLFEMAKEGWESYADFGDEDDMPDNNTDVADRSGKLELVRVAEELKVASQSVRVQFQHPRIRIVLPNVRENVSPDVDAFVADLRAVGVTVQCGTVSQLSERTSEEIDIDRLLPSARTPSLTDTINIDCTILLALISDISHFPRQRLSPAHGSNPYHKAILRQIDAEETIPLVPTEIYHVLGGRALECTSQAAQRMREIVQCMGTSSERIRADIVLGEGVYKGRTQLELREFWSEQTVHAVPADIQFPIRVVDFDGPRFLSSSHPTMPTCKGRGSFPSSIAARAIDSLDLSPINISVFLYGWAEQIVTFTSNRVVATGLLKSINEVLDQIDDEFGGDEGEACFIGPQVYISETARSLIGKTKSKGE